MGFNVERREDHSAIIAVALAIGFVVGGMVGGALNEASHAHKHALAPANQAVTSFSIGAAECAAACNQWVGLRAGLMSSFMMAPDGSAECVCQ